MDAAATAPAAGPDSTMNTGDSDADSAEYTPPLDCMTRSSELMFAECSFSMIDAKYVLTIGATAELMTVVDARRYSRNSGTISD